MNISVLGRTDYTVGQKVFVDIQSKEMLVEGTADHRDMMLSGNYLVAAIAHRITPTAHMIDMELIKDSLMIDLNKGSPKK